MNDWEPKITAFLCNWCSYYAYRARGILFKWLNRKSQRKAYTWASFSQALAWMDWPVPRIRKDLNPCRRAEAN